MQSEKLILPYSLGNYTLRAETRKAEFCLYDGLAGKEFQPVVLKISFKERPDQC